VKLVEPDFGTADRVDDALPVLDESAAAPSTRCPMT
jgi:hypothetical protein